MAEPKAKGLTGKYRVRVCKPALDSARRLFPRLGDYMELRAHAIKLRYWPDGKAGTKVIDLDWDWVRACDGQGIGELRIDDTIGGQDNLRVIFFKADEKVRDPLPVIWILHVMQKKRQDFSANEIRIFKARRNLIVEHFYKNRKTR